MILYYTVYIILAVCMFIVNIINFKKLKKEYQDKIEEHIIFSVILILFFVEITIFTILFLIAKSIVESL